MKRFGQWMKRRRDELGYSQHELAGAALVSQKTISDLEVGRLALAEVEPRTIRLLSWGLRADEGEMLAYANETRGDDPRMLGSVRFEPDADGAALVMRWLATAETSLRTSVAGKITGRTAMSVARLMLDRVASRIVDEPAEPSPQPPPVTAVINQGQVTFHRGEDRRIPARGASRSSKPRRRRGQSGEQHPAGSLPG